MRKTNSLNCSTPSPFKSTSRSLCLMYELLAVMLSYGNGTTGTSGGHNRIGSTRPSKRGKKGGEVNGGCSGSMVSEPAVRTGAARLVPGNPCARCGASSRGRRKWTARARTVLHCAVPRASWGELTALVQKCCTVLHALAIALHWPVLYQGVRYCNAIVLSRTVLYLYPLLPPPPFLPLRRYACLLCLLTPVFIPLPFSVFSCDCLFLSQLSTAVGAAPC